MCALLSRNIFPGVCHTKLRKICLVEQALRFFRIILPFLGGFELEPGAPFTLG